MAETLIYPDTSIWNELCDQRVEAKQLCSALAEKNAQLVLGTNVAYEMVKTFQMPRPQARERGQELFSCLRSFLQIGIPVLKKTSNLLQREAMLAAHECRAVEEFCDQDDYAIVAAEVEKLSNGVFDSTAAQFVPFRKAEAQLDRFEMHEHMKVRPRLMQDLRAITADKLDAWLIRETRIKQIAPRRLLKERLEREFPYLPEPEIAWRAKRMLGSSQFRVTHALARSDLYLNWRYANRGSIRGDIPDDAYHVVNACSCDMFLTTDLDQADQVSHTLVNTRALVYRKGVDEPLLLWLPGVVGAWRRP